MITLPPFAGAVWSVSPTPIVLRVNTAEPVDPSSYNITLDTQFRFTLSRIVGTYDCRIDWGDGSSDFVTCTLAGIPVITPYVVVPGTTTVGGSIDIKNHSGVTQYVLPSVLHTYPAAGFYNVAIRPRVSDGFPAFSFEDPAGSTASFNPYQTKRTDAYKVRELVQWGTNVWGNMIASFFGCGNMQVVATDTSSTRMHYVTSWDRAFTMCRGLTTFPLVDMWQVTDVTSMFNGCHNLASISPDLDWSSVTKAVYTFNGCWEMTDMPALDMHSLRNGDNCWRSCGLTSFPAIAFDSLTTALQGWNNCPDLVTFGACTFPAMLTPTNAWSDCPSLTTFLPTAFPVATTVAGAWAGAASLTAISVSLPNVISVYAAFQNCASLNVDPTAGVGAPNCVTFTSMFQGATSFNVNLGTWTFVSDPLKNITFASMFQGATSFNNGGSPDIGNWDTRRVTSMASMFQSTPFNQPLPNWDTGACTTMASMFQSNTVFNRDLNNWNVERASLTSMFSGATAFRQNLQAWYPLVSAMSAMFSGSDMNIGGSPTNLYAASAQAFSSAAWVKSLASISPNVTEAPDGLWSADNLYPNASVSDDHSVNQSQPAVPGTTYTVRCAFKAAGLTWCEFIVSDAFSASLYVDLTNGDIVSVVGSGTVADIGDGWYVLQLTGTAATSTINLKMKVWNNAAGTAYAGTNSPSLSIALWQASAFDSAVGTTDNYSNTLRGWVGWTGGAAGSPTLQGLVSCDPPEGTGYTAGDILTLADGTLDYGVAAQLQIITVDGSGVPLTYAVHRSSGNYSSPPADGALWLGGTGTGATLVASHWQTKYSQYLTTRSPNFGTSRYSLLDTEAIRARKALVTSIGDGGKGWVITDGGII